jgi:REP element-mobilizing transposase RayT
MLRGNAGRLIFFDDEDRIRLCLILQKATEEHQIIVHAFCLMSNHIHFILEPTASSLSEGVHAFAGRYAQYFNRRHKLRGHLFQDRFRSILIEDGEYLKRLARYIHLNPVRANIVAVPQNYQWSSFCSYMALEVITWLTQRRILQQFGVTELEARQAMQRYTLQMIDAKQDVGLIRESTQIGAFGSDEFIKRTVDLNTASSMSKIQLIDLIAAAQIEFRYSTDEIISESREKRLVDIRSILALAVQKVPGLYLQQLAQYLNRDSSSLCRLVRRAKQSRDLEEKTEKLLEQIVLKSKGIL